MNKKELGSWGENAVYDYLNLRGAKIIRRNFRFKACPYACEIDLIAYFPQTQAIWLCEIKTRKKTTESRLLSFKQYQRLQNSLYLFKKYFQRPESLTQPERDSLDEVFGQKKDFKPADLRLVLLKVNTQTRRIDLFQPTW